jgi:polyhydroxyalkanoate synthase subunit PhaC
VGRSAGAAPGLRAKHSVSLTGDYLGISGELLREAVGSPVKSNGANGAGDRRFGSETWQRRPVFNAVRKAWQATTKTTLSLADGTPGLDDDTARKLRFFTGQFLDAVAPSNFALSNPEVVEATKDSKGRNLVEGVRNFWSDLDLKHGRLKISMSDMGAFKVGRDLAVTPGKVIYQNELMQLIQYTPTTAKVARRPLLIIPPWLNKYYVLDMQPSNSLVRWASTRGTRCS